MVKFGNNRGGNRGLVRGGGNRQQGGFKRGGGNGNFRRRDAPEDGGQPQRNNAFGGRRGGRRGGRFGGPRRGGPRREGGDKGGRDHTKLDEDMLQYWDKAGVKDKREEAKVLEKAKLDRELEEYKLTVAAGAAATEQKA